MAGVKMNAEQIKYAASDERTLVRSTAIRLRQHVCAIALCPDNRSIIEQAWRNIETGEIEWKPVEIVNQCDCC